MKQTKAIKMAYMAGFFDGEGYVGIVRNKSKAPCSVSHQVVVSIGQRDGEILDWVVGNFGGSVSLIQRDGSFFWRASNMVAYRFLKEIEPFLRYKRPQARVAIRYMERIIHASKPQTRFLRLTEHELAIRDGFYDELRALKKEFTICKAAKKKDAGVTTKCVNLQVQDAIV